MQACFDEHRMLLDWRRRPTVHTTARWQYFKYLIKTRIIVLEYKYDNRFCNWVCRARHLPTFCVRCMTLKYAGASILPLFCTRTVNPELLARELLSKANRRKTGVQRVHIYCSQIGVRIECVTHEPKLGGRYYRPPVWPDIDSWHGTTKYVVCVSVCWWTAQNGWTDRDAVWGRDRLGWAQGTAIR